MRSSSENGQPWSKERSHDSLMPPKGAAPTRGVRGRKRTMRNPCGINLPYSDIGAAIAGKGVTEAFRACDASASVT